MQCGMAGDKLGHMGNQFPRGEAAANADAQIAPQFAGASGGVLRLLQSR